MKVDSIQRTDNYLDDNQGYAQLSNTTINYRFFYSNYYPERNVSVIIIKTKDEPKYLSQSNFIVDYELYKELFGDLKLIEDLSSILGMGNDKSKNDNNNNNDDDNIDKIIKIVEILSDSDDGELALYKLAAKSLLALLTYDYNQKLERFKKFIETKLEEDEEENIDIYFKHIGDNFYAKNYIGFKSVDDINKFMRFDYKIYKKKFPSFRAASVALGGLIFMCLLIVGSLYPLFTGKDSKFFLLRLFLILPQYIIFYGFSLGFFIYALIIYIKVNKNKKLEELKSIKSDEFINSIIDDFVSECKKSSLIIATLIVNSISIVIHIISMIFYYRSYDSSY